LRSVGIIDPRRLGQWREKKAFPKTDLWLDSSLFRHSQTLPLYAGEWNYFVLIAEISRQHRAKSSFCHLEF
jgi:hypothetical protein